VEENLEEKEFEGATGNESLSGMGNNRGFREKANGLKSQMLLFVQKWQQ
jgi:hypothetical protein